jgi:DNA-binding beta-propeller fold protein YncE
MSLRTFDLLWLAGPLLAAAQEPPATSKDFGSFERQVLELQEPAGAAIAADGSVFVAESLAGQVRVYEPSGAERSHFGERGEREGQLLDPRDLALAPSGEVFVVDAGNHRVQVFAANGMPARSFGAFGDRAGEFNDPQGIGIGHERVAIADARNHRVQVFDLAGQPLLSIGKRGFGEGEFNRPLDVAFDERGNLYVADCNNQRIQKFDAAGKFVTAWGDFGQNPSQFACPTGVEWHGGRVYVADRDNSRIQVFDEGGKWLYGWGVHALMPREANGKLHYPNRVAVAPSGAFVVVVEEFEDRFQVFVPKRPLKPGEEELVPLDMTPVSHFGMNVDAQDELVALIEPAIPSVQLYRMSKGEPILIGSTGTYGRRTGQMLRPEDVAIDFERRRLYVCDPASLRLLVFGFRFEKGEELGFDPQRIRFQMSLDFAALQGTHELAESWPIEPATIELDRHGNVYLGDPANRAVWEVGSDLNLPERVFPAGRPTGIGFVPDGRICIVDQLANCVDLFRRGSDIAIPVHPELDAHPFGVCIQGLSVFVTDSREHSLIRNSDLLGADGQQRAGVRLGKKGLGALEFFKPKGLAASGDNVFVMDWGNHRLQILSPEGEFKRAFGSRQFVLPAMKKQ